MKKTPLKFLVILAPLLMLLLGLGLIFQESASPGTSGKSAEAIGSGTTKPPQPVTAATAPAEQDKTPAEKAAAPNGPRRVFKLLGASTGQPLVPGSAHVIGEQLAGRQVKGRSTRLDVKSFAALSTVKVGEVISFPLNDQELAQGTVDIVLKDEKNVLRVAGPLAEPARGRFCFAWDGTEAAGMILLQDKKLAYMTEQDPAGALVQQELLLSAVMCVDYTAAAAQAAAGPQPAVGLPPPPPPVVPVLNSRPSAVGVLYLDFDGEEVTEPAWGANARFFQPFGDLTQAGITELFNRVKEDFAPFNVNVTTERSRYDSAPVNRRMRCIFTPDRPAGSEDERVLGVAYLETFARKPFVRAQNQSVHVASDTIPCWSFTAIPRMGAQCASHEFGHTLGLKHDNNNSSHGYYVGHGDSGPTNWSPIMGSTQDREVDQWSKGQFLNSSNNEDDLAIIASSSNGLGFIPDEAGNTQATAAPLSFSGGTAYQSGVITQETDSDFFSFATTGGSVTLAWQLPPDNPGPNLDIKLEVLNAGGTVVASADPADWLTASLTATLPAGSYFLKVSGVGVGDPYAATPTGYTSYGSIGAYVIWGSGSFVPARPSLGEFTVASTGVRSASFNTEVTSLNNSGMVERGVAYAPTAANADPVLGGAGVMTQAVPGAMGTFTGTVSGLAPGTQYSFRAFAHNGVGTSYSPVINITTPAEAPTVVTQPVENITESGARLVGLVQATGGAPITQRGFVFSFTSVNPLPEVQPNIRFLIEDATDLFTCDVEGLTPMTSYSVQAFAKNSMGTTYGPVVQFTTGQAPTMVTNLPTRVEPLSATLSGTVQDNHGFPVLENGFVYSEFTLNPDPRVDDAHVVKVVHSPTMNFGGYGDATGLLKANTIYAFRAYGRNSFGTGYGDTRYFTTPWPRPLVGALDVFPSATGAAVHLDAYPNGYSTNVTFSYGLTGAYGQSATVTPSALTGIAPTNVKVALTGLARHATYHFRFSATNAYGTTHSADRTFTTTNTVPVANSSSGTQVQTNTPVNIPLTGSDEDGDALTYVLATPPANGTVTITGSMATYTPVTGYLGTDSFGFTARDNYGGVSAPATVSLLVKDGVGQRPPSIKVDGPGGRSFYQVGSLVTPISRSDDRQKGTATLLRNGKVLISGGGMTSPPYEMLGTVELYDPITRTSQVVPGLPTPRARHTVTMLGNGKVLFVGGADSWFQTLSSAYLFDSTTNSWTSAGNLAAARQHHTATLLSNGKVLVVGGVNANLGTNILTAELYDPVTNSWSSGGTCQADHMKHTATELADGRVMVVGGNQSMYNWLSVEIYQPWTNSWITGPPIDRPRYGHTATDIGGGRILVAGGSSGPSLSDDSISISQIYNQTTGEWTYTSFPNQAMINHTATAFDGDVLFLFEGATDIGQRRLYTYYEQGFWPNIPTSGPVGTMVVELPNKKLLNFGGGQTGTNVMLYDYPARVLTAAEGAAATQSGSYTDPDGWATVTLTPSSGTVTVAFDRWTWRPPADTDGPATSTVTITATDATGAAVSETFTFSVTNAAPVATIAAPATAGRGDAVDFAFTATDTSTADQAAGFAWTVNYGDGTGTQSVAAGTASPLGLSHTYTTAGTFNVIATATDKDGGVSATATRTITIVAPAVPVISSVTAEVSSGGVALLGTVNPSNSNTVAVFHYGTTPSYGQTVLVEPPALTGTSPVPVSALLSGLQPHTLYHYRLSATNAAGTVDSPDGTFTTLNSTPVVTYPGWHTTDEDTPLVFSLDGLDADGDALTFAVATPPAHGTVSITGSTATYTPAAEFQGDDSFTVTAHDGFGGVSEPVQAFINVVPLNDPPTLAALSPLSVNEDAGWQTVELTGIGTGAADELDYLTVTASYASSNPALMDGVFVEYLRPASTGRLTLMLRPDAHGTATITVNVNDGLATTSRTFDLVVNPVNDAPSFALSLPSEGSFTAYDNAEFTTVSAFVTSISPGPPNEAGQAVSFTVTNTNNELFSMQPAIWSDGTLTFMPDPSRSGTATVTVTAQDDGGTANGGTATSAPQTFTFTVLSRNANLAGLSLSQGILSPEFSPVQVTDYAATVPNSTASLTVTPITANAGATVRVNNGVVPSGSASPALPLQVGLNPITILVTAQDGTTTRTYTVAVTRQSVTENALDNWAAEKGLPPSAAGPMADADGDGVPNLMEFAFGTSPSTSSSAPMQFSGSFANGVTMTQPGQPVVAHEPKPDGTDFRAVFVRRADHEAVGLTYNVKFSADLVTWQTSTVTPTVLGSDGTHEAVSVPYPPFIGGKKARFFTVGVDAAP